VLIGTLVAPFKAVVNVTIGISTGGVRTIVVVVLTAVVVVVDVAFEVAQEHDDTNVKANIRIIVTTNQSMVFFLIFYSY
jgi:hypothetical protein